MRVAKLLATAAAALACALVLAANAAAAPEPYGTGDFGGFRNVLPPGTNGLANASDAAAFNLNGTYPPHAVDQLDMYEDLVYAAPGLSPSEIGDYFKDATFGVKSGEEERVYSPPLRPGVTIVRDSNFGVPHIYGTTRSDVIYGAGYVAAEDRLFFMDALRHAGRATLSDFAGGANKAMDAEQWQVAPYTEADLQRQVDQLDDLYGAEGVQIQQDGQAYIDGINGYILEARINPLKLPAEYAAIGEPLQDFVPTDVIAIASLVGGIFGKGGGGEVASADVLTEARQRFRNAGDRVWRDFRRAEDPEAPTTIKGRFPYPGRRGKNGVALPDDGSVVSATDSASARSSRKSGAPLLSLPKVNSNALLVSAANSESGRPIAVMGPQVAYFMPEILLEQDLHCVGPCQGGPDIDAAGASFPGISPYVLLGHGKDYAWSATSAGQDIIDTFAEELCELDGSQPTLQSNNYMWHGECTPMETLTRTNVITPNAADPSPPEVVTLTAHRTIHGIVASRGTVDGEPVAFTRQRSTYFHEVDSARGFLDLNNPDKVDSAADFHQAMSKIGFTFNWFYADDQDIAYFNSGDNPIRDRNADPDLPNWGTGNFDWQGFNALTRTADYTPFSEHPQAINGQAYMTSWNNKQARDYNAADDQYSYGPLYRSQRLDDRIDAALAGDGKMNLVDLIDAMEDAGTVDLRGDKVLPLMLDVVGRPSDPDLADAVDLLRAWHADGSHRRDLDQDGTYEHARAIEIMDAWWPRAVEAHFRPTLGNDLFEAVRAKIGFDNEPNNHGDHLGSAYQSGWYGYVHKDLRRLLGRTVNGAFSRTYCGGGSLSACRNALRASLRDAVAVPASQLYDEDPTTPATDRVGRCPAGKSDQWCFDSVRFRPVGAIQVDTIHWIDRPTFQQAVEVQGHRPR